MEIYILKFTLCSTVLIVLFYLFLEKEKSFRFNRFYLIFALAFSYLIPFFSIKFPQVEQAKSAIIFQETASQMMIPHQVVESAFNWNFAVFTVYGIISFFLLMKSAFAIFKILKLKGKYQKIDGQKVKLLKGNISPFSFFGTLYLGENYLINNRIDERIFLHEKNHIQQKHSLDLLFVEFLIIISWFNPALYYYKKAMISNHEFLADENVIQQNFEIKPYQQLILEEISTFQNRNFTHQFNFNNTKKRFIMMTKPNSRFTIIKKIVALPAFALLFFLFAQKVYAVKKAEPSKIKKSIINTIGSETLKALKIDKKDYLALNDTIKKPAKKPVKIEPVSPTPPSAPSAPEESVEAPPVPPTPPNPAEFPGGIAVLRNKVSNLFDGSKMSGDEVFVKTSVNFRIDENGKVSEIIAYGTNPVFNAEAINSFKKANSDVVWKPATEDGIAVASRFKIPLTMKFEPVIKKK